MGLNVLQLLYVSCWGIATKINALCCYGNVLVISKGGFYWLFFFNNQNFVPVFSPSVISCSILNRQFGPIGRIQRPFLHSYPLMYIWIVNRANSILCGGFDNYLCNIYFKINIYFYFGIIKCIFIKEYGIWRVKTPRMDSAVEF